MSNILAHAKCNFAKDEVFFKAGETIDRIALLISGQVTAYNEYFSTNLTSGAVLGIIDGQFDEYIFNYRADTDVAVFVFDYINSDDIKKIFKMGVSYQELAVTSSCKQFNELYSFYNTNIEPLLNGGEKFHLNETKCQYILEIASMQKDIYHTLFTGSDVIPYVHISLVEELCGQIHNVAMEMLDELLVNQKAEEIEEVKEIDYTQIEYTQEQVEEALQELRNSVHKILAYSQMDIEKIKKFQLLMNDYHKITHLDSLDNNVREMKASIATCFYELYEYVFFKVISEKEQGNNIPKVVMLFLNFGFFDDTSFEDATLVDFYYDDFNLKSDKYNVYTIFEWLEAIYSGKREASKNEFDLDYREQFREMKKTHNFGQAEEQTYMNDQKAKVRYEIQNMFRVTNKLTSGEITRFCPVLHQKNITRAIGKMIVDARRIEQAIDAVVDVDYSLFYRENLYYNEQDNIEKIYIMKEVKPDIILMPNAGDRGLLWQDIADSKRDNPGRLIFPIFTVDNTQSMFLNVLGAFRWELCKTMQGTRWNDVRDHSLTSEYVDYVQFYRKNKELSEDAKTKLKSQFQKCRNSFREVFVKDYETWIQYEAKGSIRLNKVARRILAMYVPFSKKYRDKVTESPIFADGIGAFTRENSKKLKEVTNQYRNIEKNNGVINQVLKDNLEFYNK